VSKMQEALPCG